MQATIHFIRSKLEENIKQQLEDAVSCVNQKTQGLHKELTEKIDETQVDLQAIRSSVDMRTKSLLETITDTQEHIHKELGVRQN
jgi:2-hydroxy-3-keto-5-methylthiopentenyl-1-phosphate phosphatase